jgi:hypothetical protein
MLDGGEDPIGDSGRAVIKGSIQATKDKLSKYEVLLEDNYAGWASMILDPRYKTR